jgi:hypothetical protein
VIPLIVGPVAELLNNILNRVLPDDPELKAKVELELAKADWSVVQAQLQVNAAEARHESIFVAGWRPFVGWVCGSAFAWTFVAQPMIAFGISAYSGKLPELPVLDTATMMQVLLGMLGLGGLRTFEKFQSANKRR